MRIDTTIISHHFTWNGFEFYFLSTDHCQNPTNCPVTVPVTQRLPITVAPRPGVEDGIMDNFRKWQIVHGGADFRIANPDPAYAVEDELHLPQWNKLMAQWSS